MVDLADEVELTATDAACLNAIREGVDSKTRIAVVTKRDLGKIGSALSRLAGEGLIIANGRRTWRATDRGKSCNTTVMPESSRRRPGPKAGTVAPDSTADRLLRLLDRPKRGSELVDCLSVSPQRVHQLTVRLHAHGRLRIGDPQHALHIVARHDDPTVLLTRTEERILSALPDDVPTVPPKIANATGIATDQVRLGLARLCERKLVREAGSVRRSTTYALTPIGLAHPQRRADSRHAEPPQPIVKSDRVHSVLSFIDERRQARIREVRDALGISHRSMNALMQYLKRRGLVEKVASPLSAPYTLTESGNEALDDMTRRRAALAGSLNKRSGASPSPPPPSTAG